MLYDRSFHQTTQIFGGVVKPFEQGRIRHIIVHKMFNNIVGMGGLGKDLIQFELVWHRGPLEI